MIGCGGTCREALHQPVGCGVEDGGRWIPRARLSHPTCIVEKVSEGDMEVMGEDLRRVIYDISEQLVYTVGQIQ